MPYRIFRYTHAPQNDKRRPSVEGIYEWVGDSDGFAEGKTETDPYRPKGMSKIESAARWWHNNNAPVEPGYYVAVPWGYVPDAYEENQGVPFGFTIKAEEFVT